MTTLHHDYIMQPTLTRPARRQPVINAPTPHIVFTYTFALPPEVLFPGPTLLEVSGGPTRACVTYLSPFSKN